MVRFQLKLSHERYQKWMDAAAKAGLNFEEWIDTTLDAAAKPKRKRAPRKSAPKK